MQVPNCTGDFGSVEPGPGFTEAALPLQVEEELQADEKVDHFFPPILRGSWSKRQSRLPE